MLQQHRLNIVNAIFKRAYLRIRDYLENIIYSYTAYKGLVKLEFYLEPQSLLYHATSFTELLPRAPPALACTIQDLDYQIDDKLTDLAAFTMLNHGKEIIKS